MCVYIFTFDYTKMFKRTWNVMYVWMLCMYECYVCMNVMYVWMLCMYECYVCMNMNECNIDVHTCLLLIVQKSLKEPNMLWSASQWGTRVRIYKTFLSSEYKQI